MKDAKDIVLACCRDEEDIIATFIEFYLAAGFDAVYLVDNNSRDATPEIAESYAARGLPVVVTKDSRSGYERFLTDHYHWAGADASARWLFFLDCDEMILFPRGDAKAWLNGLHPNVDCLRLRQREMYPLATPPTAKHEFLLTPRAQPSFDDTFKEMSRYHPQAVVYAGKHRIEYPGIRRAKVSDIFIRHYKFRSEAQAARKLSNTNDAHQGVTLEELKRISAFDPKIAVEWYAYLRGAEAQELWRESFQSPPSVEDTELARWAAAHLLRE